MKLEVNELRKSFGEKEILHGVSFSIESGKALGLLGRNGAGKTTTIRILMDVFKANSGNITVDGAPFEPRRHQIGYLPEERGLYPKKGVREQLIYLGMLRGSARTDALLQTNYWLDRMGLMEYGEKKLETLSKGNQQKIQLIQTLICKPDILILDEPFSGLDPVNSQLLKDVIREQIKDGKLVIFSSHQMSYVEEFCEDIVILNHGQVVLEGNLRQIKREYGENRLVIALEGKTAGEASAILRSAIRTQAAIVGSRDTQVILQLREDVTRKQLLESLLSADLVPELFGIYEPSLTEIFVERTGD